MMMMMMMSGVVERVIVFRRTVNQPNRSAFRGRANVGGERVAVRRAAGRLFQMTRPATTKLLIPISVAVVFCTGNNPVRADRKCLLLATAEIRQTIVRQLISENSTLGKLSRFAVDCFTQLSIRQAITSRLDRIL